ncbi:MAG: DUF4149 domain-containing protein [Acidobacteriota bacterium]
MSLLRYIALVGLGLWIGGLVALGAVGAPTLFSVLEAAQGPAGRELAGMAFGAIFERFQLASLILGALVVMSLGFRAAIGPRPRHFKLRLWAVIGLLVVTGSTAFLVAPRIDRIRQTVSGPMASLPETDPRRVAFGRLHGLSNALMVVTVLVGLGLFWAESTDRH